MDYIYVLINDGSEWEDLAIILSKEDAIKESKIHPKARLEIFGKNDKQKYTPTYNFYMNGEYIQNSMQVL